MYACSNSHPIVVNTLFHNNQAELGEGGGLLIEGSAVLANCTLVANHAEIGGGLLLLNSNAATIANCILWDNWAPVGAQLHVVGGTRQLMCCDVEGGTTSPWFGPGCIDADPLFANPPGGDFRLLPGSPCIDAGISLAIATDLAGRVRVVDDPATPDTGVGFPVVIDMGVFEFGSSLPCPADLNGDQWVNAADLAILLGAWGMCP